MVPLLALPIVPLPSRGNLFTRTLSDIVSKEDFVLDSEYLITLLVIVPKYVDRKAVGGRGLCSVESEVGPLCPAGPMPADIPAQGQWRASVSTDTEAGRW